MEHGIGFDLRGLVAAEFPIHAGAVLLRPGDGRRVLTSHPVARDVDDALQLGEPLGEIDQLLDDADVRVAGLRRGHAEPIGPCAVVDLRHAAERRGPAGEDLRGVEVDDRRLDGPGQTVLPQPSLDARTGFGAADGRCDGRT